MSEAVTTSGLAFRLCLFFARNPEKTLTTRELADRMGVPQGDQYNTFALAARHGWLSREAVGRGCKAVTTYRPGPRLLREIT